MCGWDRRKVRTSSGVRFSREIELLRWTYLFLYFGDLLITYKGLGCLRGKEGRICQSVATKDDAVILNSDSLSLRDVMWRGSNYRWWHVLRGHWRAASIEWYVMCGVIMVLRPSQINFPTIDEFNLHLIQWASDCYLLFHVYLTWILSKSTRMQPAIAAVPCLWSLDVEKTVNTLIEFLWFWGVVRGTSTASYCRWNVGTCRYSCTKEDQCTRKRMTKGTTGNYFEATFELWLSITWGFPMIPAYCNAYRNDEAWQQIKLRYLV